MLEDEKDSQLNAALDSMLSAYSAAEPRPGLETRIRNRLRAHTVRRRQQWMLAFATAAALLAVAVFIGSRSRQSSAPEYVATPKPLPERPLAPGQTNSPPSGIATVRLGISRRANARRSGSSKSLILLSMARSTQDSGSVVFQEEKSYLSPEAAQEPEPVPENGTSRADLNIHGLGVQPVEIKELAPAKDNDLPVLSRRLP